MLIQNIFYGGNKKSSVYLELPLHKRCWNLCNTASEYWWTFSGVWCFSFYMSNLQSRGFIGKFSDSHRERERAPFFRMKKCIQVIRKHRNVDGQGCLKRHSGCFWSASLLWFVPPNLKGKLGFHKRIFQKVKPTEKGNKQHSLFHHTHWELCASQLPLGRLLLRFQRSSCNMGGKCLNVPLRTQLLYRNMTLNSRSLQWTSILAILKLFCLDKFQQILKEKDFFVLLWKQLIYLLKMCI